MFPNIFLIFLVGLMNKISSPPQKQTLYIRGDVKTVFDIIIVIDFLFYF